MLCRVPLRLSRKRRGPARVLAGLETISMAMKPGDVLRPIAAARGGAPFPLQVQHLHAKHLEPRA